MDVYMKSGHHVDVHWTSKGRPTPIGRAGTTKLGNFYYKVGQQLQSSAVQRGIERNRGNRFWQPTFSFNPNLSGDKHLQGLMRS